MLTVFFSGTFVKRETTFKEINIKSCFSIKSDKFLLFLLYQINISLNNNIVVIGLYNSKMYYPTEQCL